MESPLASIVQVFAFILILPFLVLFVVVCEVGKLLWRVVELLAGEKTAAEAWRQTEPKSITIHPRGWRSNHFQYISLKAIPVREINLGDFPSRWPLQAKRALALLPFRVNPFNSSNQQIFDQLKVTTGWERLSRPTTRVIREGDCVLVTFKADDLEVCVYCRVDEIAICKTRMLEFADYSYIKLTPITSDFDGPFGWLKKLWRLTFQCVGFSCLWQPNGHVLPENWPAASGANSWLCWYERDQPIVWGWRRDC
jgi:hypothetical protein